MGCSHKSVRQLLDDGFQEDGRKAIRLYKKAVSKDKNNVEGYWRLGNEYSKMKQYKEAIKYFDIAIQIDSAFNNGYLFGDRGNVKEVLADFTGAIEDYSIALKFCHTTVPTTPKENFFFYRGRTELKFGDTTAGYNDTDSALYYWNTFPRARYQKARLLVIKGNYQEAKLFYEGALDPSFASDNEFLEDVFFLGLLKFKTDDTSYCSYWKAAAKYKYAKANQYLDKYCK